MVWAFWLYPVMLRGHSRWCWRDPLQCQELNWDRPHERQWPWSLYYLSSWFSSYFSLCWGSQPRILSIGSSLGVWTYSLTLVKQAFQGIEPSSILLPSDSSVQATKISFYGTSRWDVPRSGNKDLRRRDFTSLNSQWSLLSSVRETWMVGLCDVTCQSPCMLTRLNDMNPYIFLERKVHILW